MVCVCKTTKRRPPYALPHHCTLPSWTGTPGWLSAQCMHPAAQRSSRQQHTIANTGGLVYMGVQRRMLKTLVQQAIP